MALARDKNFLLINISLLPHLASGHYSSLFFRAAYFDNSAQWFTFNNFT